MVEGGGPVNAPRYPRPAWFTLIATRIRDVPFGSTFVEKTADDFELSLALASVFQRLPGRSRWSCTVFPANDEPATTRVEKRPPVITRSETAGRTPTATGELPPSLALAL